MSIAAAEASDYEASRHQPGCVKPESHQISHRVDLRQMSPAAMTAGQPKADPSPNSCLTVISPGRTKAIAYLQVALLSEEL